MRKTLIALAVGATVAVALVGCGKGSASKGTNEQAVKDTTSSMKGNMMKGQEMMQKGGTAKGGGPAVKGG